MRLRMVISLNRKKKKYIALLSISCLIMVIMSGCGKEDDSIYGQVTGISDQSITI